MAFLERRLHGMQRAIRLGQAFYRGDGRALGLDRQNIARLDRVAILDDGAGATLCGVAANVGSGELEVFAYELDQQRIRCYIQGNGLAIDGELNLHCMCLLRFLVNKSPF